MSILPSNQITKASYKAAILNVSFTVNDNETYQITRQTMYFGQEII